MLDQIVEVGRYADESKAPATHAIHQGEGTFGQKCRISTADIPTIERAFGLLRGHPGRPGQKPGSVTWICSYCGELGSALLCNPELHYEQHETDEEIFGRDDRLSMLKYMTASERDRRDRIVKTRKTQARGTNADESRTDQVRSKAIRFSS